MPVVTREGALRHYGVVLGEDGVDQTKTAEVREARRRGRLEGRPSSGSRVEVPGLATERVIGEYLETAAGDGRSMIRCRRCGWILGTADEDPRSGAVRRITSLAEAGPWPAPRYGGQSPSFVLEESLCPGCGTLFDVEERLLADLRSGLGDHGRDTGGLA